jgi:chemotaxis protein methyltransferase CheR
MAGISPQQLPVLSDLVGRWTGLHFPADRYAELERGIARASKDFGHQNVDSFVSSLMAAELSSDQIQTLAWHLTIGETYFLRGKSTFDVLSKEILPELILRRKGKEQYLRLWSAGCSGGEEPYSMAISTARLLPDIKDWNIHILATDINTRSLQKATNGVYGNWSFRDTPDWLRPQFFDASGNDWAIRQQVKKMVSFSYLNLAVDPYPSLATNTNAMDIIFCRNVIMYFSPEVMKRVIANLYEALRDGGYLFVAPSEASQELFPQFERVSMRGEIFYKKDITTARERASGAQAGAAKQRLRVVRPVAAHPTPAAAVRTHTPASRPAPAKPAAAGRTMRAVPAAAPVSAAPAGQPKAAGPAAELVARARSAANEGHLNEALGAIENAIKTDKLTPGYRYLYATILDELDKPDEAVKALNSALYLDPDYALAHVLLGNIARRRGKRADAQKNFGKALATLETMDPDAVIPESEGMTAGKLGEMVKSLIEMEAS